ncbi:MAG: deoxyguanosinetriphosphate triphosphohydrolase [Lachnospiraceae bacterium]|nr:deoxyguanosinetriphosphate triphosphohydrolase [Lachnospiraceae bacterium]
MPESIRRMQELREHEYLSPYASFSDMSRGRDEEEEPCDIRTCYQRDRDRIIHSKAFRRLNGKTQVFLAPQGDHYRTRLTHTLEVSQIARTIAKALRLNEDLTEAIALGHDLGHTPFGHAGERALNDIASIGFQHHEQSVRVVEILETKNGKTLNLTREVRDGILNHQTEGKPATLEGRIVRFADKIAYINHDIDDAIRGQILKEDDDPREYSSVFGHENKLIPIPTEYADVLGHSVKDRLNTIIHDIISVSEGTDDVRMSPEVENAVTGLRQFMFRSVYTNQIAKSQEKKAEELIKQLFTYYTGNSDMLPEEFRDQIEHGDGKCYMEVHLYSDNELRKLRTERAVCDYIAGMTDRFAVMTYQELMIPNSWNIL